MNGKLGIQKAFENQPGQCLDDKLALTFERTLDFAASRVLMGLVMGLCLFPLLLVCKRGKERGLVF